RGIGRGQPIGRGKTVDRAESIFRHQSVDGGKSVDGAKPIDCRKTVFGRNRHQVRAPERAAGGFIGLFDRAAGEQREGKPKDDGRHRPRSETSDSRSWPIHPHSSLSASQKRATAPPFVRETVSPLECEMLCTK